MPKIEEYMNKKIAAGLNNGCTLEKAGVRREWCVQQSPVALQTPPGRRSLIWMTGAI